MPLSTEACATRDSPPTTRRNSAQPARCFARRVVDLCAFPLKRQKRKKGNYGPRASDSFCARDPNVMPASATKPQHRVRRQVYGAWPQGAAWAKSQPEPCLRLSELHLHQLTKPGSAHASRRSGRYATLRAIDASCVVLFQNLIISPSFSSTLPLYRSKHITALGSRVQRRHRSLPTRSASAQISKVGHREGPLAYVEPHAQLCTWHLALGVHEMVVHRFISFRLGWRRAAEDE